MSVVALPVWGVHFWFARRFAMRDPFERASALRRLYLYWACLASSLAATLALSIGLQQILMQPLDNQSFFTYVTAAQSGWAFAVLAGVWGLHFLIASRDRGIAGEEGASATLRRWYMYIALLVGLLTMLGGMQTSLQFGCFRVVVNGGASIGFLSNGVAQMVAGALL